jgi:hypothetical protein
MICITFYFSQERVPVNRYVHSLVVSLIPITFTLYWKFVLVGIIVSIPKYTIYIKLSICPTTHAMEQKQYWRIKKYFRVIYSSHWERAYCEPKIRCKNHCHLGTNIRSLSNVSKNIHRSLVVLATRYASMMKPMLLTTGQCPNFCAGNSWSCKLWTVAAFTCMQCLTRMQLFLSSL